MNELSDGSLTKLELHNAPTMSLPGCNCGVLTVRDGLTLIVTGLRFLRLLRSASFGGSDAISADELLPSSGLDWFFRRYQLACIGRLSLVKQ